jgi:type IV secretion system protein VirD4
MYTLSRLLLTLAVLLLAYCVIPTVFLTLQLVPPERQGLAGLVLAAGVVAVLGARKARRVLTACGTAAWAGSRELEQARMLHGRQGLLLGFVPYEGTPLGGAVRALLSQRLNSYDACRGFFDSLQRGQRRRGRLVRLPQAVHTMVVAPTGVGKGVSCIVPFLLTCPESCVVVDFKGENTLLTAERRRRLGQDIVILDPFQVATPSRPRPPDTLNPLDFIDAASPLALDECRDLAEALVIRTGEEKDPHWCDSAEAVIAAVIAAVVFYGPREGGQRSLQAVRDILAHPQKFNLAKQLLLEHGGLLARWGGQLEHLKGDELASVLSTANRFLRFLDTQAIADSTTSSSFHPAALRSGRRPLTMYLVLPPEHMRAQSALLRLWIGSLFRACLRGGLRETNRVHFILDEAAALGHLPALDDAVDKYRGYGIRLQFYYQSLGQLKKCWPSDQGQTLLSNTTKVFFGTSELQTAEFISKSLGQATIVVDSGGSNSGWSTSQSSSSGGGHSQSSSSSRSGGSSHNWQQQGRELLKPDEVLALDPRLAITLTPGVRPLQTRLLRYYEEKALLRPRGPLTRLAGACGALLFSAALFAVALALAAALTSSLREVLEQRQAQLAPAAVQPQAWPGPR